MDGGSRRETPKYRWAEVCLECRIDAIKHLSVGGQSRERSRFSFRRRFGELGTFIPANLTIPYAATHMRAKSQYFYDMMKGNMMQELRRDVLLESMW